MNFSTDLPKSNPLVTYIVASAMKCSRPSLDKCKFKEIPCYRMHAVILKNKRTFYITTSGNQILLNNGKGLILCHIRKVVPDEENSIKSKKEQEIADNVHATPKKFKQETIFDDNPKLSATTNIKAEKTETVSKGVEKINLKKRGIPLDSVELDKEWNGYLRRSKKLMEEINSYEPKNYQELYKRLMKET